MLVTRILGDCPGCGGKQCYGNVFIQNNKVLRGCTNCKFKLTIVLPEIRKKIIYLDQFFFSGAFRAGEHRFVEAAQQIRHVSDLQLLVAPFSSIHEEETHQWRGYGDKNKDDLMEFIKATSRGHEFKPAYEVQQTQIIKAFKAFIEGHPPEYSLEERDAVEGNVHKWDDYFRIDVGRYMGDIELIRELKGKSIESLVGMFDDWRQSTTTFEQDVTFELQAAGRAYLESYFQYVARLGQGDYSAVFDSPIISMVVQRMLLCLPEEMPIEESLKLVTNFFNSKHFAEIPYQLLSARMFAVLKDMVKRNSYANREQAIQRLSGFFHDVKHIATYAPYCDAFIMDQPMAALVADPRVGLEKGYGVKIFSLNTWDKLFSWLVTIEAEMTEDHKAGLSAAYP